MSTAPQIIPLTNGPRRLPLNDMATSLVIPKETPLGTSSHFMSGSNPSVL